MSDSDKSGSSRESSMEDKGSGGVRVEGSKRMQQLTITAPPSSVYSERFFSEMGQVYEKKRSRLRPELAENLLFLHHNMIRFEEYEAEEEAAVKAVSHKQKVEHGRFDKLAVIIDRQKREKESDQFMNEDENSQ